VDEGVPVSERTYIFLIFVTPKQVPWPTTSYILLVRVSVLLEVKCQIVCLPACALMMGLETRIDYSSI